MADKRNRALEFAEGGLKVNLIKDYLVYADIGPLFQ
mgnify:CR=1 FL=1